MLWYIGLFQSMSEGFHLAIFLYKNVISAVIWETEDQYKIA